MTRIILITTIVIFLCAPQAFSQQGMLIPGATEGMEPIAGGGTSGAGSPTLASGFPGTTFTNPSLDAIGRPAEPTGVVTFPSYSQGGGTIPAPEGTGMPTLPVPSTTPQGSIPSQANPFYSLQNPPPGMEIESATSAQDLPTTTPGTNPPNEAPATPPLTDPPDESNPELVTEDDPPKDEEEGDDKGLKEGWKTAGLMLLWVAGVGGFFWSFTVYVDYRRQNKTLLLEKADLEESLAHANRVMAATTASGREPRDPPPREPREPARRREERTY